MSSITNLSSVDVFEHVRAVREWVEPLAYDPKPVLPPQPYGWLTRTYGTAEQKAANLVRTSGRFI